MHEETNAIGVFDSGVGGLTVLRELVSVFPRRSLIYLGDTARVPYGTKSPETIRRYAVQCTRFLMQHRVGMVIIACNTASALAMDAVQDIAGVPVVGTIEPAVDAALKLTRNGRIGVIGTAATIASNAFQHLLAQRRDSKSAFVPAQACRLFVPLAEEGWHRHPVAEQIAGKYLAPMRTSGIDTLILGCTHYPLLIDVIQAQLPDVALVNSGAEAARTALRTLQLPPDAAASIPGDAADRIRCFVSDKTEGFSRTAASFLGFAPLSVDVVNLEDY